jgi:hypothetical protein
MLQAVLDGAHETLADDRPHRATHEAKLESGRHDLEPLERPGHDDERVLFSGRLLRRHQAIAVALAVAELERIVGFDGGGELAR